MILALAAAAATTAAALPATLPTPRADRVVAFAALNKRNGQAAEFSAKPGDTVAFATLTIRVRSCETTPPWEQRLTGAYLQIDDAPARIRMATPAPPRRVYSGWMFAESPSLNPRQHPLYDVWVRSCTMSFPETGPDTVAAGASLASRRSASVSSAPKSPSTPSASAN